MVDKDDPIVGVNGLDPIEKIKECCDFGLRFYDLRREQKEGIRNLVMTYIQLATFFLSYLVRLHRFQHSEAPHIDNANQMTLPCTWIQVHQWHDVLRELSVRRVSSNVDDLNKRSSY